MKRKTRANRNYKFTEKKQSRRGMAALAFAFAPLLLFFYTVSVSYMRGGQAPEWVGCIGVGAVIVSLLTLRVSVGEARKEKVIKKTPVMGAVLSSLMLAGWIAVYIIGWIGL